MFLPLITDGGAANGKPSGAAAGVTWKRQIAGNTTYGVTKPIGLPQDTCWAQCTVTATVTAAAAGTVIIKLWWYYAVRDKWIPWDVNPYRPLGSSDANRGKLNNGNAIGEIDTVDDFLRHGELVYLPLEAERFYAEVLTPQNLAASTLDVILHARGDIK